MSESAAHIPLRRSPLHDRHVARGAKMSNFGGWEMPIEYPGGGVMREHAAVRETVGVFDVSHLGKVGVRGPDVAGYVNSALTNDLGRIRPGQAQYSLCLDDASGGVVDDLIAYLRGSDDVFLVPNAANSAAVVARLAAEAPGGVTVTDEHERYAVIAVQGPRCEALLGAIGLPAGHPYMSFVDADWHGTRVVVCRTGYTGERGYELLPRWDDAGALWDALLAAGAALGALPVGLAARDTLRTEMGYPLHGQDLSLDISPVQARLNWAIGWKKPAFWGRERLLAEQDAGPSRLLWGIKSLDRGIPRPGMAVLIQPVGGVVGEVTSGTFSPTLKRGIGLALLPATIAEGDEVSVDVRGRPSRFRVVKPPFVASSTR